MEFNKIIQPTAKRVALHTDIITNHKIRCRTLLNLYRNKDKKYLSERIQKLDREWDTERVLETNAALLILFGSYMGLKHNRLFYLLTGSVGLFLLWHAINGWCPPLNLIRQFGIRTPEEISQEKMVLKLMRGDFGRARHKKIKALLEMAEKS